MPLSKKPAKPSSRKINTPQKKPADARLQFCDLSFVEITVTCPKCGSEEGTDYGRLDCKEIKRTLVHECQKCGHKVKHKIVVDLKEVK